MVKDYFQKIKELGIGKLLLILLAGILLVFSYSVDRPVQKEEKAAEYANTNAEIKDNDELAESIREILLKMEGIQDANVVVTYLDSGRKVLVSAKNTEQDSLNEQDAQGGVRIEMQNSETEEYLYIGDEPYVVMQTSPTVCGVVVVYKGNADKTIDITEAVKVLTGIDYNRIKVLLMN